MAPDPSQLALLLSVPMFGLVITCAAGLYVLRPLDRAAKKNKCPTRFTIVDFLALIAHLSVPLALFTKFSRGSSGAEGALIMLAGFGCFAAALIWWGTVKTAARAGITDPKKRFFMIALIVPITFCAAIVVGSLAMYLLVVPWTGLGDRITVWPYLLEIGMIVTLIVCRRTTLWILKAPEVPSPPENLWAETES
jgi:uncharacterized membrane protein YidH (DUF202 family)